MSGRVKAQAAYVEEIDDETGKKVRRSAKKEAKEERPSNERRSSRKEKEQPASDSRHANTTSSSGSSPRIESKRPSREERRMSSSSTASPKKSSSRPPSVHHNATFAQPIDIPVRSHPLPILIQQPQMRALAQQAPRPSSFHEGVSYNSYAPPLSNSAYYVAPGSLIPAPSYPSPSPIGGFMTYGNGSTYHPNSENSKPQGYRQDYFAPVPQQPTRTLVERLGGNEVARRRLSVYNTGGYEDREYESSRERTLPARKSSLRKTKDQIDAEAMPPPRRRGSVRYADEKRLDERSQSRSRPVYQDERSSPRPQRPNPKRHSVTYAYGSSNDASIEPERSNTSHRRNSYYAPQTPSYPTHDNPASYEDKFQAAEKYQHSVGGPPVRLTAESLKKANRRSQPASSHSTRSSGSRDESERQRSSVTTRTTGTNRTGTGEEDITIKLKGQGTIKIAGAEIDYDKDTELNIRRGINVGGGGSQRSSDYGASDERRDRRDRGSDRSRMSSNMRSSRERRPPGGMF